MIGGKRMAMEPISVDKAIEVAKRKNLNIPGQAMQTSNNYLFAAPDQGYLLVPPAEP